MNHIITFLTICIATHISAQEEAFITTWATTPMSTTVKIPTTGSGYKYDVDWENDGNIDDYGITGTITHDYGVADTFQIAIYGDFPRIHFGGTNGSDKSKFLSIDNWGEISWETMNEAFLACSKLEYSAVDQPDLSKVSDMSWMFAYCTKFNGDISNWNTENVTDMSSLFDNARIFNQALYWNTSNVTIMSGMFRHAYEFDQDWIGM